MRRLEPEEGDGAVRLEDAGAERVAARSVQSAGDVDCQLSGRAGVGGFDGIAGSTFERAGQPGTEKRIKDEGCAGHGGAGCVDRFDIADLQPLPGHFGRVAFEIFNGAQKVDGDVVSARGENGGRPQSRRRHCSRGRKGQ